MKDNNIFFFEELLAHAIIAVDDDNRYVSVLCIRVNSPEGKQFEEVFSRDDRIVQ